MEFKPLIWRNVFYEWVVLHYSTELQVVIMCQEPNNVLTTAGKTKNASEKNMDVNNSGFKIFKTSTSQDTFKRLWFDPQPSTC